MTRRTKLILGLVALAVLGGGGGLYALKRGKAAKPGDTATVQQGPLEVVLGETGRLEAMTQVEVKSKVAGQVAVLLVDVGEKVRKGQLLLSLDTTEMRRQRAQAAAERDIARARLDRLVAGARREELAQARAQLARAQAAHDKAREDDARARAGLAAQTITVAEASQAAAAARQARAQLDEARAAHALMVAGTRREELAEARAQLARAKAALEAAEDQLAYAAIRAPIDGTVIRRGIEVGEMVSPGVSATAQGTSMLTIANLDRLVIKSALNQVDIGKVVLAQRVDVRVDAAPGKVFAGSIHKIAPAADTKDASNADAIRTFPIETRITVGGEDARFLKPGMSAELDIHVAKKAQALYLPVEAVQRGKGDAGTVWLPAAEAGGEPTERTIRLGLANESQLEVLEGLAASQTVLLKPPATARKPGT